MQKTNEKTSNDCSDKRFRPDTIHHNEPDQVRFNRICRVWMPAILSVFLLVGLCLADTQPSNPNADQILSAVEQKYKSKSFSVRFKQTTTLVALDMTQQASGMAFFSHPGKMRWEYQSPEPIDYITDGKMLWIFRPEENQVMVGASGQLFEAGAGGAFLSDISLIRKHYNISITDTLNGIIEMELTPKRQVADIAKIEIQLSECNHDIIRAVTYNAYEDATVFDFYDIRFTDLDPAIFNFDIPSGVNVLKMD